MKLYVGNLPHGVTEQELNDLFLTYGQVSSVRIIKDKFSGESRGFAFVEMGDNETAKAAIAGLNGAQLKGQSIRVNEARPQEPRSGGGGGFDRRRSSGGGSDRGGFGSSRGGGGGFGSRGGDRFNR